MHFKVLYSLFRLKMNTQLEQLQELKQIRALMERSSRFISLSGLSGVSAGFFALVGASLAYYYLDYRPFQSGEYYLKAASAMKWGMSYKSFFMLDALSVVALAIGFGIYFTTRKARVKGQSIWDKSARQMLLQILIPLCAGGVFCLKLLYFGDFAMVAPATLIFYGLALVNGSKFTLHDVFYFGVAEVLLGLIALFNLDYGLEFWTLGFGVLHIVYGYLMYYKYERTNLTAV